MLQIGPVPFSCTEGHTYTPFVLDNVCARVYTSGKCYSFRSGNRRSACCARKLQVMLVIWLSASRLIRGNDRAPFAPKMSTR